MASAVWTALGGLGLFLLGMAVMTEALESLAGDKLGRILARFTRSPWSGAVTGAMTTGVLQSSTATTVAAVGFVGAGLLSFPQALGVLFGASVGSTVTGWLVALFGFELPLTELALPLLLVGVLMRLFGPRRVARAGIALAGFALVFRGIGLLQSGMAGFEGRVTPAVFPPDDWPGRLALVGVGALVTVATQSSGAGVAAALTALHGGALTLGQAGALVIGMNVGTTSSALLASLGGSTAARRTGISHVVHNLLSSAGAYFLLPAYLVGVGGFGTSRPEIALVLFHTLFNVLGTLAVLPFAGAFARVIERLVPERGSPWTGPLDRNLVSDPSVALDASLTSLGSIAGSLFTVAADVLARAPSPSVVEEQLLPLEVAVREVRAFLGTVGGRPESEETRVRYVSQMHALDHMARTASRLRRRRPAPAVRQDASVAAARARIVERFVAWSPEPEAGTEEALGLLWRSLDEHKEPERRDVLRRASEDLLDPDLALGMLDELRRLRRLAYHAWRIAHHLRLARRAEGPREPEAEALPPHAELEAPD